MESMPAPEAAAVAATDHAPPAQVMMNGCFLPRAAATMDIEDRGVMFADGVYEVVRYYGGVPLAIEDHHQRMAAGLRAIEIEPPTEFDRFPAMSDELVGRCGLAQAKAYWQVTRGVSPREHEGSAPMQPTSMMIAYAEPVLDTASEIPTTKAIALPDERWLRCSIKTTMLLPNVLAKRRARAAGATEAILYRDGTVTEGTTTNVLVVVDGQIHTHPANGRILEGITRRIVLSLASAAGIAVEERAVTVEELHAANEVLLCGTTSHLTAVTHIDGHVIGDGHAGPIGRRLHAALMEYIQANCLAQASR